MLGSSLRKVTSFDLCSKRMFSEMSETAQVLLKLHGSKDCFLERKTENRRKRSSPYISNQFKDGLWKRFNLKDLRWENLNQDEVAVECI